jgi:uncharacterized protein YbjT (DUF2867 family)
MILVTGASGEVGRLLVDLLRGEHADVRAVSRTPAGDQVPGDPSRPETLPWQGVTSVFVNPRAVRDAIEPLLALATKHGVRRVVALTAANTADDLELQPSRHRGDRNREVDAAVEASGLEWVSLRPTFFASNVIGLWASQCSAGDVVYGPYPTAAESPIDPRDIAEVATKALLTDDLLGSRPVLSGPESFTYPELADVVGHVLGRPLRFQEVPPAVVRDGLVAGGLPAAFADALLGRLASVAGQPAPVTEDVAKILGRPARTFAEWVTRHASAFVRQES